MVFPLSLTAVKVFQRFLLAAGSMPVVGSSRKIIGGLPMRAMPMHSFLLLPPLLNLKKKNFKLS